MSEKDIQEIIIEDQNSENIEPEILSADCLKQMSVIEDIDKVILGLKDFDSRKAKQVRRFMSMLSFEVGRF